MISDDLDSTTLNDSNVINIFTRQPLSENFNPVIRIAPENDGLEMLYSNDTTPDKLFSLKVVAWALHANGEINGLVPWLNGIVPCHEIDDPLNGQWEGYRHPDSQQMFFSAPTHKIIELESAIDYFEEYDAYCGKGATKVLQEVPDTIGTHAALSNDGFKSFSLMEVISWRLMSDGSLNGMLVNESKVETTPVLPGDSCLFPAQEHENFRYFFQHKIANKIKSRDPDTLEALSSLIKSPH